MKKIILIWMAMMLAFAGIAAADSSNLRAAKRDAALKQHSKSVSVQATVASALAPDDVQALVKKLGFPENISSALARKVGEGKYQPGKIKSGIHVDAVIKNGVLSAGSTLKWKDPDYVFRVEKYTEGEYVLYHVVSKQDMWFRIGDVPMQEVAKTEVKPEVKGEAAPVIVEKAETVQTVEANKFSENGNAPETKQKKYGSFPEASIWTGAWTNPKYNTGGFWFNMKYLQWFTKYEQPENFGIGANIRGDYGKILKNGHADWGYFAPGIMAGYYRGLGLRNSFQADASLLWRFDKNRQDGFMPAFYAEFNRVLNYKNRLIFQVDGSYFPDDSWLGPGIYWEHKWAKDWKTVAGAGASLSWLDGDFIDGFMPSLRVRYKNRWNVGVNANLFTGLGTFYGIGLAYELTPDITTWYQEYEKGTIKMKQEGTHGVPDLNIEISEKTIDEMEGGK